jgi:regulator-associated protein of mTOR
MLRPGLLKTHSADGIIKLYRNYDSDSTDQSLQLVTGFRALSDLSDMREVERGSGVVTAWSQHDGALLVGGDSQRMMLWNAHTEHVERVSKLMSIGYVRILLTPDCAGDRHGLRQHDH